MLQFLAISHLLRGAGTGVMVVALLAVSMIIVALTGSNTLAGLVSAAVTVFAVLLILTIALHIIRFVLVAGLSLAVMVKRIAGRF